MKNKLKYVFMALWLAFFSVVFAIAWPRVPWLWFLDLPENAWIFLISATGSYGGEKSSDLVVYVGLIYGFVFASIILASFLFIRKKIKS